MVRSDRRAEAAPTLRHRVALPVQEDPPWSDQIAARRRLLRFAIVWRCQCRRTLRGPIRSVAGSWFLVPGSANPQPSTLNPQPFNPQPSTFNLQPSTFNLQPSTSQPVTSNRQPSTSRFEVSRQPNIESSTAG